MEIIKKVYDVKSLIRFRSVSKPWKSFIDSSDFIKGYGARHTQPYSHILRYRVDPVWDKKRYIRLVEDDKNETFKVQQQELAPSVVSPLLKQYHVSYFIGECHGLLCFFCYNISLENSMFVIWNPSIRKSFGIAVPSFSCPSQLVYGFGVCPITSDPTVVKILQTRNKPWHVEVFTLSSGVWNVIPIGNLPRQSIELEPSTRVFIDRFMYWAACEATFADNGEVTTNHMVVSLDLITMEFKVVDLPDTLKNELLTFMSMFVSKLRGSLVVYGDIVVEGAAHCSLWVMEHDSSFRKLFTIGAPVYYNILGFRKSGEPIFETRKQDRMFTTLDFYDPCSQQIKNLGISGIRGSFFMGSYKESLLLLDHTDLHIYSNNN